MIDIIKNPMFIAIVIGTLTYIYMLWNNNYENSKIKNKNKRKNVNILIPAVVTIVVWAIVYGYYSIMEDTISQNIPLAQLNNDNIEIPRLTNKTFKLIDDKNNINDLSSESAKSYQLVGKGLNIPNNLKLPEVFIETF